MRYTGWFVMACVGCLLSILCLSSGALAEGKKVYTLQGCVKEALANNWKLKAKKEQIDQAEYVKNQARADFLPKLSILWLQTIWYAARGLFYRPGGAA